LGRLWELLTVGPVKGLPTLDRIAIEHGRLLIVIEGPPKDRLLPIVGGTWAHRLTAH
jgi:hypothetical protein